MKDTRISFAEFVREKEMFDAIVNLGGGRIKFKTKGSAIAQRQRLNTFRKRYRENQANILNQSAIQPQRYDFYTLGLVEGENGGWYITFKPKEVTNIIEDLEGNIVDIADATPQNETNVIDNIGEEFDDALLDEAKAIFQDLGEQD